MRDPSQLGEALLRIRRRRLKKPLSEWYDEREWNSIEDTVDVGPTERYGDPRLLPSTLPN
jgi:hypothetical protein